MSNRELKRDQDRVNKMRCNAAFCAGLYQSNQKLLELAYYHVHERGAPLAESFDPSEMASFERIEQYFAETMAAPNSEDTQLEARIEAFGERDNVHALFTEHGMMASDVFRLLSVSIDGLGMIESQNVNSDYASNLILAEYGAMSRELAAMADKAACLERLAPDV